MVYNKKCLCCFFDFVAKRIDNVFCSRKCKAKNYRKNNLASLRQIRKQYYLLNKDKELSKCKEWKVLNADRYKKYTQAYYIAHKDSIMEKIAIYNKQQYRSNPQFRLKNIIRRRLGRLHLKKLGVESYSKLYGCSVVDVVKYIETLFYTKDSKMSWENFGTGPGTWQIDHIIPLCKFNLTDMKQLEKACNYTNLQPLWFEDHCKKTREDFPLLKKENIPYEYK